MSAEKDTTFQLRVSSDTLSVAREIYESEGKSISQAVREFLEETVVLGRTPIRHTLSCDEQEYKSLVRREERAVDNICKTTFSSRRRAGESAKDTFLRVLFGENIASELDDEQLRDWGRSVGLPKSLSLTALAELYDCGLFPKCAEYVDDDSLRVTTGGSCAFGAENIRQNMELVKMRLLAGALSAMNDDNEEDAKMRGQGDVNEINDGK